LFVVVVQVVTAIYDATTHGMFVYLDNSNWQRERERADRQRGKSREERQTVTPPIRWPCPSIPHFVNISFHNFQFFLMQKDKKK